MSDPHLLDLPRWQMLTVRLAELAAAHSDLALQCDAIRAPVETLDRLWRDALPALHGDRLAAERIGALTAAAGPVAALVDSAQVALARARASSLSIEHRPGVIRIGELAIIAIAAARAAPRTIANEPSGSAAMYVHVIHGLALQATPAEILARLDLHGGPLDVLADLIARLLPRALVNGFAERIQLRRFVYDPVELGRWTCLASAFGELGYGPHRGDRLPTDLLAWSPARADGIASVTRRGKRVAIRGQFPWASGGGAADPALAAVLGARPDGATGTSVERGRVHHATAERLTVDLGATVEWVGYALAAGLEAARGVRAEIRGQLDAIGAYPCVANPALSAAIADPLALAELAEAPPRGTANGLADPLRVTAWLTPTRVAAGDAVTLSWSAAARSVEIVDPRGASVVVGPTGSQTFRVADAGTAAFHLYALRTVGAVDDDRPPSAAPTAARRGPERRLLVEVTEPVAPGGDAAATGDPVLTFVVFRPRVLAPDRIVDAAVGRQTLDRAAARLGARADLVELPWIEDVLAVTAARPSGADDPHVAALLEQLDRAAARTPGLEHAIWIALVPDRGDGDAELGDTWAPFAVGQPGAAALAVAVASPAGVLAALADAAQTSASWRASRDALAVSPDRARPAYVSVAPATTALDRLRAAGRGPAQRLRLVGVLTGSGVRLVDAPRLDPARAAGPGAPGPTELTAVCLDAADRELARIAIGAHRAGEGVGFVALVAVTADTAAVELRVHEHVVLRIERPSAVPRLGPAVVARFEDPARCSLDWRLISGSAREVVVEIAATGEAWVPLAELCGCSPRQLVPLWRLAPGDLRARIVATDGWNVDAVEIAADDAWRGAQRGPFVLRRVGDGQVWADVPAETELTWTVPSGVPRPDDDRARVLALPPRATGEIALHVAGVVERVALGEGDGHRRH